MKISHSHNKADYVGILGSLLCIVHCLAMPVLALGSAFGHDHHLHVGFLSLDYLFILINAAAVYFATRNHRSVFVNVLLWSALVLFAVSLIFEERNAVFQWLGYLGSALLITGHLINLYICQIAPQTKLKVS
ncbi:MerC domain-containing protein [Dyadobacter sp. LHD-138]|uniref:MerC domain-containing protein n=1 Tax=Dyadobacter sp. LHD-138 TaxID=3071413 RepID=UPI0027E01E6D|nr:MerC domain-containing protein [Dyadobacter sp. LHD-138]MDQ6478883.1 MerC domain-containing protein [Dyadobacter sp. LHD-138]